MALTGLVHIMLDRAKITANSGRASEFRNWLRENNNSRSFSQTVCSPSSQIFFSELSDLPESDTVLPSSCSSLFSSSLSLKNIVLPTYAAGQSCRFTLQFPATPAINYMRTIKIGSGKLVKIYLTFILVHAVIMPS